MSALATPGPWKHGHMGDAERHWIGPDWNEPIVAYVDREITDGNLALVCAAPELYDALEALLFRCELYLGKWEAGYTDDAIMIRAGEALAKARGEQVLGAGVKIGATPDAPNSTEGEKT